MGNLQLDYAQLNNLADILCDYYCNYSTNKNENVCCELIRKVFDELHKLKKFQHIEITK